ncbi:MAG: endolytic transglycosylase MltG [Promicromonosporaceae bacterium]|nr:endolytic transglycosylase MltG [Promicromonosporaceae bacterium]
MSDLFDDITVTTRRGERRRAKVRRRHALTTALAVAGMLAVGCVGMIAWHTFVTGFTNPLAKAPPADFDGPAEAEVQVTIPVGASGTEMGQILRQAGVVASVEAFTNAYAANPEAARIQPGTYALPSHLSATDAIAALLVAEKIETKVTFPEGFTAAQIIDRMEVQIGFDRAEMEALLADPTAIGLPEQAGGNAEGWLFPATYSVQPSDTPQTLLMQMVAKTVSELTTLEVAPQDWEATLIVASLVEREAKAAEDRPMMARTIQNRLDLGMPLQVDAAVAYGLGKSGTELTIMDTEDASNPYNTYVHLGLPPGPIANPGISAVKAVLAPAQGEWLYWTAVNLDTGETKFAVTYEEHLRNVEELRAWQAANGR